LKAASRAGETELDFTKAIANLQVGAVEEISHAHAASGLRLYFDYPERGLIAALHDQIITVRDDYFSR
jgi:hypothetical protein